METARVAYFSMEIALENSMPTYCGGLGVLAGDTLRAAADQALPLVGISLLHRNGYFYQRLSEDGVQQEEPVEWAVENFLQETSARTTVPIEGRDVAVRAWKYPLIGRNGYEIPVYLLDTNLPENTEEDRRLTDHLYGGDDRYRLCQEVILGIGGVHILAELGHGVIERFHMNEGHAALLTTALLEHASREVDEGEVSEEMVEETRKKCVFTTHTPVPAGHDKFSWPLAEQILGSYMRFLTPVYRETDELNMTYLALRMSRYVNGVARKHTEISRKMFAGYEIDSITNGVHAPTWVAPSFQKLFDRYIPGWREDNVRLRYAGSIPPSDIWEAHMQAKTRLIHRINQSTNVGMRRDSLTLGFARRSTLYKRPDLLVSDPDRLNEIASTRGPIQIVYAGKAHPKDEQGKALIKKIMSLRTQLSEEVKLCYLENYDLELGQLLTASTDLWVNTPLPPNEASGTSGMKAALNGVPSFSTLDGWWIEGHLEGITGWAIGNGADPSEARSEDSSDLYRKLGEVIVPLFYDNREEYIKTMRNSLAINGSFFTTERMIQEYASNAYRLKPVMHEPVHQD
jgi:starch phosphorylase